MHICNSFLPNLHIVFNELYLIVQSKRVFITPDTKPEWDSIVSLVKAANGQVSLTLCSLITPLTRLKEAAISMAWQVRWL